MIVTINIGSSSVRLGLHSADGETLQLDHSSGAGQQADMAAALNTLVEGCGTHAVSAVCHRIVHGGAAYTETCLLTPDVERAIEKAAPLAPLHNPPSLRWLAAAKRLFPAAQQLAAFDTGLYADLPAAAAHYAVPENVDVRRLGFHGLAHRCMLRHVAAADPGGFAASRTITLQLGSGCSATAARGGRAIDTSMGYTPLEGLIMATRCGDIDPGLVLHLLSAKGRTTDAIETLLGKQSGLLGISGQSADIRELLVLDDTRAVLAVDMFCYRVRKYIGAYAAALGGVDHIVFGGGTGENQPEIRARILEGLAFLGVEVDPAANTRAVGKTATISPAQAAVTLSVCAVDENRLMAQDAGTVMKAGMSPKRGPQ